MGQLSALIQVPPRPNSLSRHVALAAAVALTSIALLILDVGKAAAQAPDLKKVEKLDSYFGHGGRTDVQELDERVRAKLAAISNAKYACREDAKAAIAWLEAERTYVGNIYAPGPISTKILDNLEDDIRAELAKLKALPPCVRPRVTSDFDRALFQRLRSGERRPPAEEERVEIGSRPCLPGSAVPCSWTGPYAGVQIGGSWSGVRTNEYLAATGVPTNAFTNSGSGFSGGINLGHNWQPWGDIFVVGTGVDVNLVNDNVKRSFAGGTFISSTINFTGAAQVRAGGLATPALMLYVQTGIAIANQNLKINFGGPITSQSQITPGFTLGAGAEWQMPTPLFSGLGPTSLFIDYNHTWWDKARLKMPVSSPLFNYTWSRQSDTVKVGLRVKFLTQ